MRVAGWAPGYPAHAPPCWGERPSRLRLPTAAVSARWRAYCSTSASDSTRSWPSAEQRRRAGHAPLGWQPSRFLADRTEAERAFALAELLGSVNATAQELGTTWLSLRKAFTRHGLGMAARNPEVVRQRAIQAAHQRTSQPVTPVLDPMFVVLNPGALPARERSAADMRAWDPPRRGGRHAEALSMGTTEISSKSVDEPLA
jgi:hypothetical protein